MKREYTYTVHIIVENGRVVDDWVDECPFMDLRDFCDNAVRQARDADAAAAEEAADAKLEARKEGYA